MFVRLVLMAVCLNSVTSHQMFQARIPNGASVPFPCKPGETWQGVGHILNGGTGVRNPFGLDFAAANYTWTKELCQKDSDGDGLTNGNELGDPDCEWKENAVPKRSSGLSHPGICDPWDSPNCMLKNLTGSKYPTQNEWMADMCKAGGLDCPAINETGILTLDLRLPNGSRVPPQVTTYMCQIYNLTEEGVDPTSDFHMVAVTPIIDNRNILHHMVLFGCTDDTVPSSGAFQCGMVAALTCQNFMHVWTVGLAGECYHPDCGVRIGPTGYKIVAIQLHWNNPEKRSDFTDTSGFHIYYTPNLRPYDAGVLMIGDINFNLPPKKKELTIRSTCSGTCTRQLLTSSVNVTSAWNHMHYAGNKMDIQVYRNGSFLQYLTEDTVYSYDSPQVFLYPNPLVLQPGDSLATTCGYTTMNRNITTTWGEATQDEMCFGFLTFYPKQNMPDPNCVSSIGISWCDPETFNGCLYPAIFLRLLTNTHIFREVASNCKVLSPCQEECVDVVVRYMRTEACMQGRMWEYIQNQLAQDSTVGGLEFLSRIASCKVEIYLALQSTEQSNSTQSTELQSTQQSNSTQSTELQSTQQSNSTQTLPPTCPTLTQTPRDSALKTSATTSLVFLSVCVLAAQVWS